ncbi:LytR/AlgR family response regulator transcription factor [Taibaiella soli]|uniref:DNA-binding response regulator n=1 Tax=Taibaiella soli TaxID=1649169 RepID=A0A2W2AMY5_9BACT|nr:LytTR family DNA-binding domain-containing protein [Taibaiella soli]PZF74912.1 DNA-binding response regulator [Taibaiella soli]
MRINCIIVEDEPLAMERTKSYVQKVPFLNLLACFDNGMDALAYLRSNDVQLIFLDINLGEISGIQMAEAGTFKASIIFTTAYHEYALKSYELNATDYLLKPFTFERFLQAVNKVNVDKPSSEPVFDKKFIFVKTEYRLEKVFLDDIYYIEGMRDYRKIHTGSKAIMTLQTFTDLELEIPSQIICRVHKSFMVSLSKIEAIERDRIRIKDQSIPISETYRKRFFELINHPIK